MRAVCEAVAQALWLRDDLLLEGGEGTVGVDGPCLCDQAGHPLSQRDGSVFGFRDRDADRLGITTAVDCDHDAVLFDHDDLAAGVLFVAQWLPDTPPGWGTIRR